MAIEKLLGIEVPVRAQYIRVMFDEITRILNHLMWLGAHGARHRRDDGVPYCFREREDLMDCYEAVSGARMHATYYRPGGVYRDLPDSMPQYQRIEVAQRRSDVDALNETRAGLAARLHRGLHASASRATSTSTRRCSPTTASGSSARSASASSRRSARWRSASPARCCAARASPGTCARSSPTRSTTSMDFDIPVGVNGDCYDRYLVRVEEMRQSNRIIQQCVDWLRANPGPVMIDDHKVAPPSREEMKGDMEELIHHFKLFTEGYSRAGGRGLRRGRAPEGRVRHLPRVRRRQQAVSPEVPRAGLRAPGGARRDGARATCSPTWSRSSARRTSCSERSIDERRAATTQLPASALASTCATRSITGSPSSRRTGKRSAVIAALRAVQDENGGYLTRGVDGRRRRVPRPAADRRCTRSRRSTRCSRRSRSAGITSASAPTSACMLCGARRRCVAHLREEARHQARREHRRRPHLPQEGRRVPGGLQRRADDDGRPRCTTRT